MISSDVDQQLRQAGLRVTAPRQSVLWWLAEHPHTTAEQIRRGVAQLLGSVSNQTIYDVLAACTSAGLVRRIEPAGHPARFERRTGDNHHHLVCRSCGRTEDVDCAVGARPCLAPGDDHGFAVDEAEVVFWGRCPSCTNSAETINDESSAHHNETRAGPTTTTTTAGPTTTTSAAVPTTTRRHGSDEPAAPADHDRFRCAGRER